MDSGLIAEPDKRAVISFSDNPASISRRTPPVSMKRQLPLLPLASEQIFIQRYIQE
jgi:hypothetical protein